jgi:hypothetical protein
MRIAIWTRCCLPVQRATSSSHIFWLFVCLLSSFLFHPVIFLRSDAGDGDNFGHRCETCLLETSFRHSLVRAIPRPIRTLQENSVYVPVRPIRVGSV